MTAEKANCCSRMTAGTTRHLIDTISFAIDAHVPLSTTEYTSWRRRHMVLCARMRPLSSSAVAHTLFATLSSLDGHPFVETTFVEEVEERREGNEGENDRGNEGGNERKEKEGSKTEGSEKKGDIAVWCTLRANADVNNYGFDESYCVSLEGEARERVRIERNGRAFTLLVSPRDAQRELWGKEREVERKRKRSVCDMVRIPGMAPHTSFPNAPRLTCDVVGHFDSRYWSVV